MTNTSLVITDATLPDGRTRDVRINQSTGKIDAVDTHLTAPTTIPANGNRLLPGMIDVHVHLRQPGDPQKETWHTGTHAAAAGGVTTVLDQPNTSPPTISGPAFDEKTQFTSDAIIDYGLNAGVTPDWDPSTLLSKPIVAVGEIFLADSTGDMGITTALFTDALLEATKRDLPVTVHAEDADYFDHTVTDRTDADAWSAHRPPESEVAAVEQACEIATNQNTPIHIAHTSTPTGIDIAHEHTMTCEVTPHHLLLSRDDLPDLGTYGRMNPPLRSESSRQGVYDRVKAGKVTMIATDHAPHTKTEKATDIWSAPSGVPGVETALPLLLAEATAGHLSFEQLRDLTATNPARTFGLTEKGRIEVGYDADLVLIDPTNPTQISADTLHTKCGWTPFEGWDGLFPEWTMVRGQFVYKNGSFGDQTGRNAKNPQ